MTHADAHGLTDVERRQITVADALDMFFRAGRPYNLGGGPQGRQHQYQAQRPVDQQVAVTLAGAAILAVEVDQVRVVGQGAEVEQKATGRGELEAVVWFVGRGRPDFLVIAAVAVAAAGGCLVLGLGHVHLDLLVAEEHQRPALDDAEAESLPPLQIYTMKIAILPQQLDVDLLIARLAADGDVGDGLAAGATKTSQAQFIGENNRLMLADGF